MARPTTTRRERLAAIARAYSKRRHHERAAFEAVAGPARLAGATSDGRLVWLPERRWPHDTRIEIARRLNDAGYAWGDHLADGDPIRGWVRVAPLQHQLTAAPADPARLRPVPGDRRTS